MIKTNFLVNEDEKARILNLHESATKKLYLVTEISDMEADAELSNEPEPTNKSDENIARDWEAKHINNPSFQAWFESELVSSKYPRFKKRVNAIQSSVRGSSVPDNRDYQKLGRYLRRNPEIELEIDDYARKNPNPGIPIIK